MKKYDYLHQIGDQFHTWLVDNKDRTRGCRFLEDYFAQWLDSGECAPAVGGRFDTYMRVVVTAIDAWHKDQTLGGAIDPPAEGIMNPQESLSVFIDPEYFAVVAFANLQGRE